MTAEAAHFFDDTNLKRLLRKLVQEKGRAVQFDGEDFQGRPTVSSWGWMHYEAFHHIEGIGEDGNGCSWIIEDDARLIEETYTQVNDSECEGLDEVGINLSPARCACGKYRDMHLRYAESLGEVISYLLNNDGRGISI